MLPYKRLLRPLFFRVPAEPAHKIAESILKRKIIWKILSRYFKVDDSILNTSLSEIPLSNPIGLAAGFDKNCQYLPSMMHLGFGYLVGGTVTLDPRDGNPKPRLLRDPKNNSIINSLGFPGQGIQKVISNLAKERVSPLILSASGFTVDDLVSCALKLEPWSDGIEINISSPNSKGLKIFHDPKIYGEMLGRINSSRKKPLFVKLPPYNNNKGQDEILQLVNIGASSGIQGFTIANTKPITDSRLKMGNGGLSGKLIFNDMLQIIKDVRKEVRADIAINACGGISTAEDAILALKQGANTIQIYSALIYEGPGVVKSIKLGLKNYLDKNNLDSITKLSSTP